MSLHELETEAIKHAVQQLQSSCHGASVAAGWWNDLKNGVNYLAEVRNNTRFGKALVAEKMAFNAQRPDHKPEARNAEGGKAY